MTETNLFLSYSRGDFAKAKALAEELKRRGVSVFLDAEELAPGVSVAKTLDRALRKSDAIVMFVGSDAAQSSWLMFEMGAAIGMGKRIVPIVAEGVDLKTIPPPLRDRVMIPEESPERLADRLLSDLVM